MRLYLAFFALGVLFAAVVVAAWLMIAGNRPAWEAASLPLVACTLVAMAAMTVAEFGTGGKE